MAEIIKIAFKKLLFHFYVIQAGKSVLRRFLYLDFSFTLNKSIKEHFLEVNTVKNKGENEPPPPVVTNLGQAEIKQRIKSDCLTNVTGHAESAISAQPARHPLNTMDSLCKANTPCLRDRPSLSFIAAWPS